VLEEADEERHATWLELFFDLVFVVVVAQLANRLARDTSGDGFLRAAGLFVPALWAWMGFAFYANRFDTDDVVYRVLKLVAMLGIVALAVSVRSATTADGSIAFASAYVSVRVVLLILYVRARRHLHGAARRIATLYLSGFGLGASLWLASVLVAPPARFALWGVGLAVELAMPLLAWREIRATPVNVPHITERFGLFFIIVLGEAVAGVVAGTSHVAFGGQVSLTAAGSFVIAACLWWIYFDYADTSVIGRGLMGLVYVYGHFVLLAGVVAMGVGIRLAIQEAARGGLPAGTRWALCGGVALYLLALSVFHSAAEWTTSRDRVLLGRLAITALVLVLALAGSVLSPAALAGLVALGLVALLALEATSFPEGAASVWQPEAAES